MQMENVTMHLQSYDEMNVMYRKLKRVGIYNKHKNI